LFQHDFFGRHCTCVRQTVFFFCPQLILIFPRPRHDWTTMVFFAGRHPSRGRHCEPLPLERVPLVDLRQFGQRPDLRQRMPCADQYVKSAFIVHVGGTRCVTSSTDNIMKVHARRTLNVEFIRSCIFIFYFYV
jgi:hypothetical protein